MPVDCILAKDSRFYLSLDNVTFTELVDMKMIGSAGSPERPDVDATPLADNTGDARQFRQGLSTSGEIEGEQMYNKTRFALLKGYYDANTLLYWRIRLNDNAVVANTSRIDGSGRMKKVTNTPLDDPDKVVTIPFTLKITGTTTFTPGS